MTFDLTSWNIQNASLNKFTTLLGASSGFGEYVGALIAADGPAIVGLMEVRQRQGDTLAPLLARVNAVSVAAAIAAGGPGPGGGWQGRLSSPQDDRFRRESSIYLWDSNEVAPSATAMPGPFFNLNVIDDNSTENVFALGGVATPADKAAVTTWLTTANQPWTRFQYQPRAERRLWFDAVGWLYANAAFPPGSGPPAPPNGSPTAAYETAWLSTLKGIDYVLCPTLRDRAPFVGQFTAAGGAGPTLTVALLHAPNPDTTSVGSAGNAMSQSFVLGGAAKLAVMGDFNVRHANVNALYASYARTATAWTSTGWEAPFDELTAAPFSATRQMGWTETSLSSSCPDAGAASTDARAEPYDLFLTRGAAAGATFAARDLVAATVAPANQLEQDMVLYAQQSMVSSITRSTTVATWFADKQTDIAILTNRYNGQANAIQATVNAFAALAHPTPVQQQRLAKAQADLAAKQAQVASLANWSATLTSLQAKLAGGAGAYDVPMAWMLIRRGVADHLPITASGV